MLDVPKTYKPTGNYRHYCVVGCRIIWELYSGDGNYMLFPPTGQDTSSHIEFFESMIKYIKPTKFWKPKANPFSKSNTLLIKEKMEAKKNKE